MVYLEQVQPRHLAVLGAGKVVNVCAQNPNKFLRDQLSLGPVKGQPLCGEPVKAVGQPPVGQKKEIPLPEHQLE